ncbi:MAG: class I SAM-dependent methyltransferase [Pseudomonadota bacterium]
MRANADWCKGGDKRYLQSLVGSAFATDRGGERTEDRGQVGTRVADMESLPFENNSFDVVTCAGSLSYGEPDLVDAEVRRVLRSGGIFICVDSLNHNPIYRFNRWIHYRKGDRTKSTLLRMPTLDRIQSISRGFKNSEVRFFGAVSYLMPILARIIGQSHAAKVSDAIDRLVHVRRSAFKFVLVARGCSAPEERSGKKK